METMTVNAEQWLRLAGMTEKNNEQIARLASDAQKNQTVIDNIIAGGSQREYKSAGNDFGRELWNKLQENSADRLRSKDSKLEFEMKANMTTSNTITGGGMLSYGQQGYVPGQPLNMRDFLGVTPSPTGQIVNYRETNAVQVPTLQSEGSSKVQLQYTFSAQTTTSKYLSATATFSRQLMYSLSFIQQQLPTLLLRDFYKKENDYLFTQIASNATGTVSGTGTVDAEELINVVTSHQQRNFLASVAFIDWTQAGRLLKTKPNDYGLPSGFNIDANGNLRILQTPVIASSFAQTDHVLVFDSRYYQRAETESLNVQFSFENGTNFEANLVTARIECFEDLARLRDDAATYFDFGNS